jgi:hypothetical protein
VPAAKPTAVRLRSRPAGPPSRCDFIGSASAGHGRRGVSGKLAGHAQGDKPHVYCAAENNQRDLALAPSNELRRIAAGAEPAIMLRARPSRRKPSRIVLARCSFGGDLRVSSASCGRGIAVQAGFRAGLSPAPVAPTEAARALAPESGARRLLALSIAHRCTPSFCRRRAPPPATADCCWVARIPAWQKAQGGGFGTVAAPQGATGVRWLELAGAHRSVPLRAEAVGAVFARAQDWQSNAPARALRPWDEGSAGPQEGTRRYGLARGRRLD